jgi:hypothetical protein
MRGRGPLLELRKLALRLALLALRLALLALRLALCRALLALQAVRLELRPVGCWLCERGRGTQLPCSNAPAVCSYASTRSCMCGTGTGKPSVCMERKSGGAHAHAPAARSPTAAPMLHDPRARALQRCGQRAKRQPTRLEHPLAAAPHGAGPATCQPVSQFPLRLPSSVFPTTTQSMPMQMQRMQPSAVAPQRATASAGRGRQRVALTLGAQLLQRRPNLAGQRQRSVRGHRASAMQGAKVRDLRARPRARGWGHSYASTTESCLRLSRPRPSVDRDRDPTDLYCCSFSSAHSVCSLLSHTPLNVPCWARRPLLKWKRTSGNCSRNSGCSTVRPTTPLK